MISTGKPRTVRPAVFVSVGHPHLGVQERFLLRLERMIRGHGLTPKTLGRGLYDHRDPLRAIRDQMQYCEGAVIVGLERRFAPVLIDRRGSSDEAILKDIATATVWTQLEAGMAYQLGLPLLIIKEQRVLAEGILDPALGEYFVCQVDVTVEGIEPSATLKGTMRSWVEAVRKR